MRSWSTASAVDGAVATLERSAPSSSRTDDEFGGLVVREKEHSAEPMTIDRALFEMELVGHDFFLFTDADSGRPSVVYRRKGYDYGVIRLADGRLTARRRRGRSPVRVAAAELWQTARWGRRRDRRDSVARCGGNR